MWHCDQLERQGDGSAIFRFVQPASDTAPQRMRKVRYFGGQDDTPTVGRWYVLNAETDRFEPFEQAPRTPP